VALGFAFSLPLLELLLVLLEVVLLLLEVLLVLLLALEALDED
jgi:hypothetical protein